MNLAIRKRKRSFMIGLPIVCALLMSTGYAGEGNGRYNLPTGVYLELTEEFYQALQDNQTGNTKRYHNNSSDEYLRQIAISSRYIVETNLKLLQQQEKMLHLLEETLAARQPAK